MAQPSDLATMLGGGTQKPLPIHPDLGPWLVRLAVLAAVGVWGAGVFWRLPLQAWASAPVIPADWPVPPNAVPALATAAAFLAAPRGGIALVPVVALGLVLLELVWWYMQLVVALGRGREATATFVVRALHPANRANAPESDPVELWRALMGALRGPGALDGKVALLITRQPNRPARMGVQIRGVLPPPPSPVPALVQLLRAVGARVAQAIATTPLGRRVGERVRRSRLGAWAAARRAQVRQQQEARARALADRPPARRPRGHAAPPPVTGPRRLSIGPRLVERRALTMPHLPAAARRAATIPGVATSRRTIESVLKQADETIMLEATGDVIADAASTPHTVLLAQDIVLARSDHWALLRDERGTGGVLRGLLRSLAVPEGVMVQEIQIIATPAPDATLRRWYLRGKWWLARLRRESTSMAPATSETEGIKTKLGSPLLSVTIRFVVVARSTDPADVAAAQESLTVLRNALAALEATYRLPSTTIRQAGRPAPIERHTVPSAAGQQLAANVHRVTTGVAMLALAVTIGLLLGAGFAALQGAFHPLAAPGLAWGAAGAAVLFIGMAGFDSLLGVSAVRRRQILARVPRLRPTSDPLLLPMPLWWTPATLGLSEVARLWSLPTAQSATEASWLPNRIIPAPASAFVPDDANDPSDPNSPRWVTLGHAYDSGGELRPVGVPLKALHQMMHITAGMGSGKSQAAAAMCHQLIPHGFIILDGKGDDQGGSLATVVRKLIPPEEEHRLFFLNVLETAYPIGLNPIYHYMVAMERATSKADRDLAFNAALGLIMGLFERLDPGRWDASPGMQQYALMGSHLVLRTGSAAAGSIPTMAKVARVLEDEHYRTQLIARYPHQNDLIYRFWTEREEQLSEAQKS